MADYLLYTSPLSQHGRRVVSLLEEAGIPYAIEPIAIEKGEHLGPTFAEVNPNRQVPALAVDGKILLESHAIMRFLCDRHGLDAWYPKEPWIRAQVDQWLDWNHYRLGHNVSAFVVNKVMLGDDGDSGVIARSEEALAVALQVLENHLGAGPYLVGEAPTIADLAVASNVFQLGFARAVPETPNIGGWMTQVSQLKGFKASLPPVPG